MVTAGSATRPPRDHDRGTAADEGCRRRMPLAAAPKPQPRRSERSCLMSQSRRRSPPRDRSLPSGSPRRPARRRISRRVLRPMLMLGGIVVVAVGCAILVDHRRPLCRSTTPMCARRRKCSPPMSPASSRRCRCMKAAGQEGRRAAAARSAAVPDRGGGRAGQCRMDESRAERDEASTTSGCCATST